jgi:dTDP-4-dehydrorhamnose reductase
MSRWLITGAHGQLGSDLVRVLNGQDVVALSRSDLDVADEVAVMDSVETIRPDVIVNAAAYTAVDAAEENEDRAHDVNAAGPAHLSRACARLGACLVHISTDYVFSGTAREPYREDAEPDPHTAYGRTKLAGERAISSVLPAHYVVRTAWLYGETGSNFVKTMIRLERERETVSVVADQRGAPTWSLDLAEGLVELVKRQAPFGIYHFTNAGSATWYDLARAVFEELGADPGRVLPTSTQDFPRPAPRPAYSVLSHDRWCTAGLPAPRAWRPALGAAMPAISRGVPESS